MSKQPFPKARNSYYYFVPSIFSVFFLSFSAMKEMLFRGFYKSASTVMTDFFQRLYKVGWETQCQPSGWDEGTIGWK